MKVSGFHRLGCLGLPGDAPNWSRGTVWSCRLYANYAERIYNFRQDCFAGKKSSNSSEKRARPGCGRLCLPETWNTELHKIAG